MVLSWSGAEIVSYVAGRPTPGPLPGWFPSPALTSRDARRPEAAFTLTYYSPSCCVTFSRLTKTTRSWKSAVESLRLVV